MKFRKLFQPIEIGKKVAKNRVVLPGLIMGLASEEGGVTDEVMDFYEARAKGGAGLIIVGGAYPEKRGKGYYGMLGIDKDDLINGYRELVSRIKKHHSLAILQILHTGRYARSYVSGFKPVAPSAVPCKLTGETPEELDHKEVLRVRDSFILAADRAYLAGFDGVEIHAGMGYLLSQFLSPFTNRRRDEYGGDLDGRFRIVKEIIEGIRKSTPKNFIIGCRISMEEFIEGGNTIEEGKKIVKKLDELGVHFISIVVGWHESKVPLIAAEVPPAGYAKYAEEAKKITDIPIIYTTRVKDPYLADTLISEGKADMVGLGRALIADPDLPIKAQKGEIESIRPCITCSHCLSTLFNALALKKALKVECSVNPRIGEELREMEKAEKRRKVLVIGAGPAGLEAAITLKLRGHDVLLVEREEEIGGMLRVAHIPPYKEDIKRLIEYYGYMLKKLDVKTILKKEVNRKLVDEESPDVVILATGAMHKELNVPIFGNPTIVNAVELLEKKVDVKGEVLIVGGGEVGLEVADLLSDSKETKVTVIEMLEKVGREVELVERWLLLKRLREKGVKILTKAKLEEIRDKKAIVKVEGKVVELYADLIVNAIGMVPNRGLLKELEGYEVRLIGDCLEPRKFLDAIREGYKIGIEI